MAPLHSEAVPEQQAPAPDLTLPFRREYFKYRTVKSGDTPESMGYAGFRLMFPFEGAGDLGERAAVDGRDAVEGAAIGRGDALSVDEGTAVE